MPRCGSIRRSLQTLLDHMHQLPTALARAVCWGAAWDMCRDAELPAADYIRLVLHGAAVESDLTAVNTVLGGASKASTAYSPLAEREAVLQTWQDGVRGLLAAAEPGSDHQLAFVRAYAAAAQGTAAADALESWVGGDDVPEGLAIDSELRWTLVRHLARLGRLDDAAIAAEEARDKTVAGAEYAAAARAARPSADAKAAAWRSAAEENTVTATTQRAISQSFWQRGQDEVLAPYVDRYFAMAEDVSAGRGVWADKGTQLRTNALTYLFPQPADLADLLTRLDAWLGGRRPGRLRAADHRRTARRRRPLPAVPILIGAPRCSGALRTVRSSRVPARAPLGCATRPQEGQLR